MGSDGDNNKGKELSKVSLDADKVKDIAKSKLSTERSKLKTEEAIWTQQPTEFDRFPPHEKPFPIEPFGHERSRIPFKMTDEDRLRRKIWVQSQELTEREPVRVPELERMIYNPIRRLYRLPTDRVFNALAPLIGEKRVPIARYIVPKFFMAYLTGCVIYYNIKYNKPNWELKHSGINTQHGGIQLLPEEEKPPTPNKWDYFDNGFQSRKVFRGKDYAY